MEPHFAIDLTPDEPDGKGATQLAASGLVANSTDEAGAQDVELGFAHGALEAEQQAVIEHGGMIDAISVANERVGEAAEIEQTVPIGIVARETGHLETEHDTNVSERDLGSETGEAAALNDGRRQTGRGLRRIRWSAVQASQAWMPW